MPLAEYLEGHKSAGPADSATKLRKQVFLQGGAMIALGLVLAGWYVGYRVFTARTAQPRTPVPVVVAKQEVKKIVTQPAPPPPAESKPIELPTPVTPAVPIATPEPRATSNHPPVTANRPPETSNQKPVTSHQQLAIANQKPAASHQPFSRHEARPRTGERYLQIAAFGPKALDGFLRTLEGQGLHPLVAPGPVDNIYRILVGPFPNATALEEARTLIKSSGVEPILRTY